MQSDFWIKIAPRCSDDSLYHVTARELELADGFGSPKRRAEFLSWRTLLHRQLGKEVEVGYDEVGAPQLLNHPGNIGVSHCEEYVALIYSSRGAVAIDIETLQRNYERVVERYLSARERELSADEDWLAIAWSAKETLYKIANRRPINLLEDIKLLGVEWLCGADSSDCLSVATSAPTPSGRIKGSCCGVDYLLHFAFVNGCVVVWCRL